MNVEETKAAIAAAEDPTTVELPLGLRHGTWGMQPNFECLVCEVGYLDLQAAVDHLQRHPAELARMQAEAQERAAAAEQAKREEETEQVSEESEEPRPERSRRGTRKGGTE